MIIRKNDSKSVFDNILYKYKNTFNINKLPKRTYNFNLKKWYDKQKNFLLMKKHLNH